MTEAQEATEGVDAVGITIAIDLQRGVASFSGLGKAESSRNKNMMADHRRTPRFFFS